jgi:hypothetical protein
VKDKELATNANMRVGAPQAFNYSSILLHQGFRLANTLREEESVFGIAYWPALIVSILMSIHEVLLFANQRKP